MKRAPEIKSTAVLKTGRHTHSNTHNHHYITECLYEYQVGLVLVPFDDWIKILHPRETINVFVTAVTRFTERSDDNYDTNKMCLSFYLSIVVLPSDYTEW